MKLKITLTYLVMAVIGAVFVFPLLWSLVSSLKPEAEIMNYPPKWIADFTFVNYKAVLEQYPFTGWMANSVLITVLSTLFVLALTTPAAYAFGRLNFRGKKLMFTLIVSMLLIPIQAYIVPLFLLVSELKLLNTFAALILVAGANVTSVYILTSFFKRIPNELEEAARIDGCKDFGIFAKIMLPLTKPAVSTVTILMFISNWNNFLWPMIAIRENALKPLTVGIAQFMGGANSTAQFQYGTSLAAACMAIIPSIIVFLSLQRYFVEGITNSGIKG
ncbi:MAG: carbohydrate ABC transporter permease [Paenibacillus macerans]|uniref:carbohydrate ABC transporter permease n=1 Tax=Paenibacillus macerans TaxID=44252 RepID=UPI0022E18F2C|nr:carbohydrate ABC transporter permease [Paenibacillus macerans]MDU7476594.1 carbohydrate ABC transporter permease [Paenibacillus macerans]MEC0138496.1 carbohydrate ABC transporter permease [Paenibacillus macerans]MEC0333950.1 carbohydrate ABC transporter permease [Paenibacillus macerans]